MLIFPRVLCKTGLVAARELSVCESLVEARPPADRRTPRRSASGACPRAREGPLAGVLFDVRTRRPPSNTLGWPSPPALGLL